MTRVLLDQGLPRSAILYLRTAGWDAEHVYDLGMSRASDIEIIRRARDDARFVCTLDADFHALLAISGESTPSIIRIRREGLKARELAGMLITVWPRIASAIQRGAMVTISERSIRIRHLPGARD